MQKLTETPRTLRAGIRAAVIFAAVLAIGAAVPQTAHAQHGGGGWHGGGGGWHDGGGGWHGGGGGWHGGGGWWWGPAVVGGLALGAALSYPYYYGYPYGYAYGYPYGYPYPPQPYYPAPGAAAYYPQPAAGAAGAYYPPVAPAAAGAAPAAGAGITYTNKPAFTNAAGQTCREFQAAGGALGNACQDPSGQWRVAN